MTGEIPFIARCARCGNSVFTLPDRVALETDMSCKVCGHTGKLIEFADLSTLDAILQSQSGWRQVLH